VDRRSGAVALVFALAAGAGALTLTVMSPQEELRVVRYPGSPVMGAFIGWHFAGAGLVATQVRPGNRFGLLMYATRLACPVGPDHLGFTDAPHGRGSRGALVARDLLHALRAFPTARLEPDVAAAVLLLEQPVLRSVAVGGRQRGHGARAVVEMAAATVVPTAAAVGLNGLGRLTSDQLMTVAPRALFSRDVPRDGRALPPLRRLILLPRFRT